MSIKILSINGKFCLASTKLANLAILLFECFAIMES